jgi:hypothetical protein
VGLEELKPGRFDPKHAWYSRRGDCVFWYSSDDFAYADRVNDDLTVFRKFSDAGIAGAKLKNVKRIFKEAALSLLRQLEVNEAFKAKPTPNQQ